MLFSTDNSGPAAAGQNPAENSEDWIHAQCFPHSALLEPHPYPQTLLIKKISTAQCLSKWDLIQQTKVLLHQGLSLSNKKGMNY